MTDRINYLTVALEEEIRSDDVEPLIQAIKMLRGVLNVEPNVANGSDWVAENHVRKDLEKKLWSVLYPQKLR